MTDPRISFLTEPPERAEMDALLEEYYTGIAQGIRALGGPCIPNAEPIAQFWAHVSDFLPPKGRLCIARDQSGAALGCGMLCVPEPGIGELKGLFVRPAARGTGLGTALVACRIAEARRMGLRRLLVDTLANTVEMQAIYTRLGFERIGRYPQSSTANAFPEMRDVMVYFGYDLET